MTDPRLVKLNHDAFTAIMENTKTIQSLDIGAAIVQIGEHPKLGTFAAINTAERWNALVIEGSRVEEYRKLAID